MHDSTSDAAISFIRPAWHSLHPDGDVATGELYQTSLMSALVKGVYAGETTFGELEKHGDFGIGTFNDLDGEMVAFDGVFYQLLSNGNARPVSPAQKTPFAAVTFFKPEKELRVEEPHSKDALLGMIEDVSEANLFTAIRIEGRFTSVRTRTVSKQARPYPDLVAATASQEIQNFLEIDGTLAGFRSPAYAQGLDVAGFHLHFVNRERVLGGHALDFTADNVVIQLQTIRNLHIELPTSADFLKANMNSSGVGNEIKKAES